MDDLRILPMMPVQFKDPNLQGGTLLSRRYKAKLYLEIGMLNQSRSGREYDQIVQEVPMDDLSILPMMPVQVKVPNLQGGTLLNSGKIRQVESWNWDAKPGLI